MKLITQEQKVLILTPPDSLIETGLIPSLDYIDDNIFPKFILNDWYDYLSEYIWMNYVYRSIFNNKVYHSLPWSEYIDELSLNEGLEELFDTFDDIIERFKLNKNNFSLMINSLNSFFIINKKLKNKFIFCEGRLCL